MQEMSLLGVFFWEKIIFAFFRQKGNIIFVTFIHIYRKYHIFIYFLRKIIFHFRSTVKMSYLGEKEIPSLKKLQKRSYPSGIFLERRFFQNIQKKEACFLRSKGILTLNSFLLFKASLGLKIRLQSQWGCILSF